MIVEILAITKVNFSLFYLMELMHFCVRLIKHIHLIWFYAMHKHAVIVSHKENQSIPKKLMPLNVIIHQRACHQIFFNFPKIYTWSFIYGLIMDVEYTRILWQGENYRLFTSFIGQFVHPVGGQRMELRVWMGDAYSSQLQVSLY